MPYFKNKKLELNNIDIKLRTNNSLENFNRYFKNNIEIIPNMNLILFLDNLIQFSIDQIEFLKKILINLIKNYSIQNKIKKIIILY